MRVYLPETVRGLAAQALAAGGHRRGVSSVDWDVSEGCEKPPFRLFVGRASGGPTGFVEWAPGMSVSSMVGMTVPCRRCPPCLARRGCFWQMRMAMETLRSERTWMSTYTLSERNQYAALCAATSGTLKGGVVYDVSTPESELAARHRAIGELYITPYWKRVRKECGNSIRFVMVSELTKRGQLHYHALVHEPDSFNTVRKAVLKDQWDSRVGHSHHKLVNDPKKAAGYVAKYLTKVSVHRVRCSLHYGRV